MIKSKVECEQQQQVLLYDPWIFKLALYYIHTVAINTPPKFLERRARKGGTIVTSSIKGSPSSMWPRTTWAKQAVVLSVAAKTDGLLAEYACKAVSVGTCG